MEIFIKILNNASKIFITIVGTLVTLIAIWGYFEISGIIIILVIFLIAIQLSFGPIILPRYLDNPVEITKTLVNYLKDTNNSLYYYGGAGYIGSDEN